MKKTLVVYGVYALFAGVLLLMGQMMGLRAGDFTLYILPIMLLLAILPLAIDTVGAVCLVVAWLPFSRGVAQFEVGVITLNPYIAGMVVLFVLMLMRRSLFSGGNPITRIDIIMICLSITYLISVVMADDVISSGYLAFHAIFVPFITYFVCRGMLKTTGAVEKAVIFLLISSVVFSLFAIVQFLATGERVAMLGMPYIGVATLTASALLALFSIYNPRSLVVLASGVILLGGLIVSFSRMYLVLLLLAPYFYRMIQRGHALRLLKIVLVSTFIGTILVSLDPLPFKPEKFDRGLERTFDRITNIDYWKGSIYGRASSYNAGLKRFVESPIIGNGLQKGRINITTHNFHVEWLESGGLIGYLLWIGLFYQYFRFLNASARTDVYVASGLLVVVVVLLNSVTNGFMHGIMPTVAFMWMGISEARMRVLAGGYGGPNDMRHTRA